MPNRKPLQCRLLFSLAISRIYIHRKGHTDTKAVRGRYHILERNTGRGTREHLQETQHGISCDTNVPQPKKRNQGPTGTSICHRQKYLPSAGIGPNCALYTPTHERGVHTHKHVLDTKRMPKERHRQRYHTYHPRDSNHHETGPQWH